MCDLGRVQILKDYINGWLITARVLASGPYENEVEEQEDCPIRTIEMFLFAAI